MNNFLKPTKKFEDAVPLWNPPHSAYNAIKELSDEQVRYALWAALFILFGAPGCNASEVVLCLPIAGNPRDHTVGNFATAEAHILLAQIGTGKAGKAGYAQQEIDRLKQELQDLRAALGAN